MINGNGILIGKGQDGRKKYTDWGFANHYESLDFNTLEGDYICFGALMRNGIHTEKINTGKITIRISKHFEFQREGFRASYYIDNKLNFSISEVEEILNMIHENLKTVSYKIEENDDYVWITFTFKGASRNEILFTLNICRRFYRIFLSVELRIAYNIWKSNKYNISLFELLMLIDNMYLWSMPDDLFMDFNRVHFNNTNNFFTRLSARRETMCFQLFEGYDSREGDYIRDISFIPKLKNSIYRSVKRNIESKIEKFENYEDLFNAYVKYLTYYVNKVLKECKTLNIIE